jgi:hypothetical protein
VITTADLKSHTKADLAEMAKRLGVSVSGSMRKDDLVVAVARASKAAKTPKPPKVTRKKSSNGHAQTSSKTKSTKFEGASKGKVAAKSKSSTSKTSSIKVTATKAASGKRTKSKLAAGKPTNGQSSAGKQALGKQATGKLANGKKPVNGHAISSKSSRNSTAKGGSSKAQSTLPAQSPKKSPKKIPLKTVAKSAARATTDALPSKGEKAKASTSKASTAKTSSAKGSVKSKPLPPPTDPKVLKRIRELQEQRQSDKDLAFRPTLIRPPGAIEPIWESEPRKDRIALFVRDAHWMHATWDVTRQAVERAKSAMMEQWHGAKPILRLIRMDDTGTTNTSETIERDIEIHGGLRNWYIEWSGEPASFRVLIGYLSLSGRFHVIAKSNIVKTLGAGSPDAVDEHWSDLGAESERLYAVSGGYDGELETGELKEMLEDRLRRTLGAPPLAKLGAGADSPFRNRGGFHFDMEVELVVYGSTVTDGYLTLNGEPVALRSDGTFALRVPFPDRRQVLPAVACSRDGSQQRTIVVAVERNTKIMEPLESEQDTGE